MTAKQEDAIYDAQIAYIKRKLGAKYAKSLNLGWGVDDMGVSTKIYGHPKFRCLCSGYNGKRIEHELLTH